jgi:hypothetical protein
MFDAVEHIGFIYSGFPFSFHRLFERARAIVALVVVIAVVVVLSRRRRKQQSVLHEEVSH